MEIVINDTNILIDLYNAGLLAYCKKLNLDFRTLDVVINEIEDSEQYTAVQSIIDEGTLSVYSLSGEQVGTVFQKVSEYNGVCNLSVEDISVMVYAIDNNCRLLTGDKKLKDKATLENVKVSGILFLTDMLTQEGDIDCGEMINALERLLSSNNRLPRKLIKERIETLKRLNTLQSYLVGEAPLRGAAPWLQRGSLFNLPFHVAVTFLDFAFTDWREGPVARMYKRSFLSVPIPVMSRAKTMAQVKSAFLLVVWMSLKIGYEFSGCNPFFIHFFIRLL